MKRIIHSALLSQFPNLTHGISTRDYGNLKKLSRFDYQETLKNRQNFCQDLGITLDKLVIPNLVHGNTIVSIIDQNHVGDQIITADGLITSQKNIFLMVTVADCLPILFYDPVYQIVGIIHAGWRGLVGGIIENLLNLWQREYQSDISNLQVFIGPGIGKCHFQIKDEVLAKFNDKYPQFVEQRLDGYYADLKGIANFILLSHQISQSQIEISADCTFCQDRFLSSYRREGGKCQLMGAVIGMRMN